MAGSRKNVGFFNEKSEDDTWPPSLFFIFSSNDDTLFERGFVIG